MLQLASSHRDGRSSGSSGRLRASQRNSLQSPLGQQNLVKLGADGLHFDAADDVAGEGVGEQGAGVVFGDAARAQVEQGFVTELPDGRAVRAFHVIGEDFQLRLGVNLRGRRKQEGLIGLLGVGLLGILRGRKSCR